MMQDTPSMMVNLPDAIRCGAGANKGAILVLSTGYGTDNRAWYVQVGAGDRHVLFNLDGTYHRRKGYDLSSKGCKGKSLQQLYNEGRAFNFVNDPKQKEKIQKHKQKIEELKEENHKQDGKIKKLEEVNKIKQEEINLLKEQNKEILEKMSVLSENIQELQNSMSWSGYIPEIPNEIVTGLMGIGIGAIGLWFYQHGHE